VAVSCKKKNNELSVSVKDREYFARLRNKRLLKNDCIPKIKFFITLNSPHKVKFSKNSHVIFYENPIEAIVCIAGKSRDSDECSQRVRDEMYNSLLQI